ncbi:hypothetical protein MKJ01_08210 [Chryseobacterium sp. SSA4.19]|uniref:hypothetical protein n=1 Tax=Chryseobacterium sp. SSA4.19 TaxID=2919915 RepID=UPI001F4D9EDA|nr:hypothetical protein [Chryseobacterium sp. SSA4.19]MCJ8153737.1 hypothetical protein [Chryseobacterium sp. SSA4.19]
MKNFIINKQNGAVSEEFITRNIKDFHSATTYIAALPYKRNPDKSNVKCIFEDFGGTCSTKHAVLRKLAIESKKYDVKLILGIFKMDAEYTDKIRHTLEKFHLKYIPEAHNYLKIGSQYFDFTKTNSSYIQFKNKLLIEVEIEYDEIDSEKIILHKNFLKEWIAETHIPYDLNEIWDIREQCIKDLQQNEEIPVQYSSPICFLNSPEVRDEFKP